MRRFELSIIVIWLCLVQVARAQDAQDTQDATAASSAGINPRKAYARGEALYRDGHYEAAKVQFEFAYTSMPNPVVLLSIAKTQEKLGQYGQAVVTLQRYLKERQDAPDRQAVEQHIQKIQSRPAVLTIRTQPAGASVLVDNRPHPKVTPTEVQLTSGKHRIEIRAQGHISAVEQVDVDFAQRKQIAIALRKTPASPKTVQMSSVDRDDTDALVTGTWISVAVAGSALVVGSVCGILALSTQSDFNDHPTASLADRGEGFALAADVSFGVAIAAGITALVLFVTQQDLEPSKPVSSKNSHAALSFSPVVSFGHAGIATQLRF
jgi:hypothetical protein